MSGLIDTILITRETKSNNYWDLIFTIESCLELKVELKLFILADAFKTERPPQLKKLFYEMKQHWDIDVIDIETADNNPLNDNKDVVYMHLQAGQRITQRAYDGIVKNLYQDGLNELQYGEQYRKPERSYGTILMPSPNFWFKKGKHTNNKNPWISMFIFFSDIYEYFCLFFYNFWFIYANTFKWLAYASTCQCGRFGYGLNKIKIVHHSRNYTTKNMYSGLLRGATTTITSKKDLLRIGIEDVGIIRTIWVTLLLMMIHHQLSSVTSLFYNIPLNWIFHLGGCIIFFLIQFRTIIWPRKGSIIALYLLLSLSYHYLLPIFLSFLWLGKILRFVLYAENCTQQDLFV